MFRLPFRPPLAWAALCRFLAGRGAAGVETLTEDGVYLRTLCIGGRGGWFSVRPGGSEPGVLQVEVSDALLPVVHDHLLPRIRRLLDLDAAPESIDRHLREDRWLAPLVTAAPGLRVPGAVDGFELALRAILGQQVTVKAATTLFSRFARRFGLSASTPHPALVYFAPTADAVAAASVQELIDLGLTGRRAQTVSTLAKALSTGAIRLEPGATVEDSIVALQSIPGIGPWTAQYIAIRALRDPDAFPHSDLGLVKATGLAPRQLLERSQRWRPWRAYAALHIWNHLSQGG